MKESRLQTEVSLLTVSPFPSSRSSLPPPSPSPSILFQDVWAVAVLPGAVREVHRAARRRQRCAHLRAEQDAGQEGLHRLWYEVTVIFGVQNFYYAR